MEKPDIFLSDDSVGWFCRNNLSVDRTQEPIDRKNSLRREYSFVRLVNNNAWPLRNCVRVGNSRQHGYRHRQARLYFLLSPAGYIFGSSDLPGNNLFGGKRCILNCNWQVHTFHCWVGLSVADMHWSHVRLPSYGWGDSRILRTNNTRLLSSDGCIVR